MTVLQTVLDERGVSQIDLARRLDVAENTVWYWANGKKPLPAGRAMQIASMFDVEASLFDEMVTAESVSRLRRSEPKTMFDWMVQNVWAGPGGNYRQTLGKIARVSGESMFTVLCWVSGELKIPEHGVTALVELWPQFNPEILCYEVGLRLDNEAPAVAAAVADLAAAVGPHGQVASFQDAVEELVEASAKWLREQKAPKNVRRRLAAFAKPGAAKIPNRMMSMAERMADEREGLNE